jgi:hypothetical protein
MYQTTPPGSDDKLANKVSFFHQLPAKVPRSSVNGKRLSVDSSEVGSELQDQSDKAASAPVTVPNGPSPIIARDCNEEYASPLKANIMNGFIPSHKDLPVSVSKAAEEEHRASHVAGHLWRELEKAVRGKTEEQTIPLHLQVQFQPAHHC